MAYEFLAWDSDFFGIPIGRVSASDSESLKTAVEEADADGVECLYLVCPVDDLRQLHSALALGFLPHDVRMELSCNLTGQQSHPEAVRGAQEEDEATLLDLVRERMRDTRFWADRRFPRDRVKDLYAEWLRRGLSTAPLRRTFMTTDGGGFVTCQFETERGVGRIELIAVAADRVGVGVGDALIEGANFAFAEAGLERSEVVTQAGNIAAQRLYQRNGYRTSKADIWLHRWRNA